MFFFSGNPLKLDFQFDWVLCNHIEWWSVNYSMQREIVWIRNWDKAEEFSEFNSAFESLCYISVKSFHECNHIATYFYPSSMAYPRL